MTEHKKSIRHYLAERNMTKDMYNEQDKVHFAVKKAMERRAELVVGIQNAEQALKKMHNPAFSDQISISIPSFRFGISVDFAVAELQRQMIEAKGELELIDARLSQVAAIFGVEF